MFAFGVSFFVTLLYQTKLPKTFYQMMVVGDETVSLILWIFLLSCLLVALWHQHFIAIAFIENT